MAASPEKIAILGGGLGSLVTTLELTSGPNAGKYEVTIFQTGWRLGGKGASGRNAAAHQRIEEHGLHIWFGCYENAFRLIREVLAEWRIPHGHPWDKDGPENRWRYAFKTADYSAVVERFRGRWELWEFDLPTRKNGEPGDGRRLADGFWSLLGRIAGAGLIKLFWTLLTLPLHLWRISQQWQLGRTLHRLFGSELLTHPGLALRKAVLLLNLSLAICLGLICNWRRISRETLDVLDEVELRDFLRSYGACEAAVRSPVIGSIYDAVFAQLDGVPEKENLAAGAGLRSMLRILIGFKHSMFYKMQAGMGDTIFTPLYEVLKGRGVTFRFFHRVKTLELSADKKSVARVRIERQVKLRNGGAKYEPLVSVEQLGCWPSEPLWEQLDADEARQIQAAKLNLEHAGNSLPDREEIVLEHRADSSESGNLLFDRVVLGISIAAFPAICQELIAADSKFRAMVENVRTVRTEAFQLWLKTDLAGLGWPGESPVFGNFLDPMNTWADMTHLMPRELLTPEMGIRNIAYLCGPMPESVPESEAAARAHVRASADAVLNELAQSFWPGAADAADRFDMHLVAMDYLRWNLNPSDRYVLSIAGSTRHRLRPGESGFTNLILTGDYTRNGWNVGCVEATVMSGMLASAAISGFPKREQIAYAAGP